MEWNNPYLGRRMSSWMHKNDEDLIITLPVIPQPRTPNEPMEFLSRSWTPSSTDVTQALAQSQNHPRFSPRNIHSDHHILNPSSIERLGVGVNKDKTSVLLGRWFHGKDSSTSVNGQGLKRKDKARLDNARVHTALTIASLASGLASLTALEKHNVSSVETSDKMKAAVASSTELIASHCYHLAQLAGAEHEDLTNAVKSSVDITTAGDLLTLTAAAATALRAEATLKARIPNNDAKNNASISPYDRYTAEDYNESRNHDKVCKGELLQQMQRGATRWKHVTIYINKKSQVMMKMKNKHIGAAFSKTKKCVVYGVCDETSTWPFKKEKQEMEAADVCLGVKTGKGLMEFKCRSKILKMKWVEGIRRLLREVGSMELTTQLMDSLVIRKG